MAKHAASLHRHRKETTRVQQTLRVIVVLLVALIVMGIVSNFLPKHNAQGATRPIVEVGALIKGTSPTWTVAAHIVAVVRPDQGGKSVMLVNSGHGTASALIPLSKLGIAAPVVMVTHVWTGITKPAGALRVVLPPGSAEYLILK